MAKDAERKPGSYPSHLQRVCNFAELSADELQGTPCIELETAPPPKQQIACTRSFGQPVTELQPLLEAVSHFAQRAAEKLRAQAHRAGAVHVFARTSPFRAKDEPFSRCATVQLVPPSSDTAVLIDAAMRGIREIYEPGYKLAKAGVILIDLAPQELEQASLLDDAPPPVRDRSALMEAMDAINARWGKGAVCVGSAMQAGDWRMRQLRKTPNYTASVDNMPCAT